jgi:hypothetical protein
MVRAGYVEVAAYVALLDGCETPRKHSPRRSAKDNRGHTTIHSQRFSCHPKPRQIVWVPCPILQHFALKKALQAKAFDRRTLIASSLSSCEYFDRILCLMYGCFNLFLLHMNIFSCPSTF